MNYKTLDFIKHIETPLNWSDLILDQYAFTEVMKISSWLKEWCLNKKLNPGIRSLFYGRPGTGKTLTATLISKSVGLDLYRVDLSMAISKYIGETEVNLKNIFDQAKKNKCILFFDETDILFESHSQINNSNNPHSNNVMANLIQKCEEYAGPVVFSANLKPNPDSLFIQNVQSVIYFPIPDAAQRTLLWKNTFSHNAVLEDQVNIEEIANKYELTGGSIFNIVRYASLMAIKRDHNTILLSDIIEGISREFEKIGKPLS